MNKFQSYMEWMPEKFKEERAKGTLDIKPSQKEEIPEWLKMANNIISRNRFGKEIVKKNSNVIVNDRLIVTSTDYYVCDDTTIHYIMIGKLMLDNIIPRRQNVLDLWTEMDPSFTKLLAMQADFDNEIKLSESYGYDALRHFKGPQNKAKIENMFRSGLNKLRKQGFKIKWESIES